MIFFVVSNDAIPPCPICQGSLKYRRCKQRIMKQAGGTKQWLCIRRFKCTTCERLHNELPDCLVPYKHYNSEIIQDVIVHEEALGDELFNTDYDEYPCYETMLRWLRWFNQNLANINGLLRKAAIFIGCMNDGTAPLLDTIQDHTDRWLCAVLRMIYNSGGYLPAVYDRY